MKKIFCLITVMIFFHSINAQEKDSYVENELIIWLEQGVDAAKFSGDSKQGIIPKRLLSKRLNIWLFEMIESSEQRSTRMNNLSKNADVKHVQNNHNNIVLRAIIPNDTYYAQQWAPAKMQLPDVWDNTFGTGGSTSDGDDIVVAVIDGGFDLNHNDLNFWKNTNEIPGNGIDDDHNGYVDDFDGWNAYTHTGSIGVNSHGTHVAGIIGAIGNNGRGVSGVNWNV
jgi:subtilisin family serine protease